MIPISQLRIPRILTQSAWLLRPLLLTLVFGAHSAQAATNTASAGTTWEGATWSLGHVPTSAEDAVINSGVNLSINSNAVCGSLAIGSGPAEVRP